MDWQQMTREDFAGQTALMFTPPSTVELAAPGTLFETRGQAAAAELAVPVACGFCGRTERELRTMTGDTEQICADGVDCLKATRAQAPAPRPQCRKCGQSEGSRIHGETVRGLIRTHRFQAPPRSMV